MPRPQMTMQEVRDFLDKNNFGYTASITGKNVIEHIEARVYPPSKMSVHFFHHQKGGDRADEVHSIRNIHKIRGRVLE